MRVLILGSAGMLGHQALRTLVRAFDVYGTVRETNLEYSNVIGVPKNKLIFSEDITNVFEQQRILDVVRPDVVINCIGIVKQSNEICKTQETISINSVLPHNLARVTGENGIRFIHMSTDCVFNGSRGHYSEFDAPDALDLYGASKFAGEPSGEHVLVVRTSIIGHEIHRNKHGLVEWFLSQEESVGGFVNAFFSGVTTATLAETLDRVIQKFPSLSGTYHLASTPISKFDFLHLLRDVYRKDIQITPLLEPKIDRSLAGEKFLEDTGIQIPDWFSMVSNMEESFRKSGLRL